MSHIDSWCVHFHKLWQPSTLVYLLPSSVWRWGQHEIETEFDKVRINNNGRIECTERLLEIFWDSQISFVENISQYIAFDNVLAATKLNIAARESHFLVQFAEGINNDCAQFWPSALFGLISSRSSKDQLESSWSNFPIEHCLLTLLRGAVKKKFSKNLWNNLSQKNPKNYVGTKLV